MIWSHTEAGGVDAQLVWANQTYVVMREMASPDDAVIFARPVDEGMDYEQDFPRARVRRLVSDAVRVREGWCRMRCVCGKSSGTYVEYCTKPPGPPASIWPSACEHFFTVATGKNLNPPYFVVCGLVQLTPCGSEKSTRISYSQAQPYDYSQSCCVSSARAGCSACRRQC